MADSEPGAILTIGALSYWLAMRVNEAIVKIEIIRIGWSVQSVDHEITKSDAAKKEHKKRKEEHKMHKGNNNRHFVLFA